MFTINGFTLHNINQEFCNTWQDADGNMQTHCWQEMFDYVAVRFDENLFPETSYMPYTWDIPMETIEYDGSVREWNMGIAVNRNNTPDNWDDDTPVCLHSDAVTVDTTDDEFRVITAFVDNASADLVDCFNNSLETFYYLTPTWGETAEKDYFVYHLVRNDGGWMWSSTDPTTDSTTDTRISIDEIETVLAVGKTWSGCSGELAGSL